MLTETTPIVCYGPWDGCEWAMFERRCPNCGRLVKADDTSNAEDAGIGCPPLDALARAACGECLRFNIGESVILPKRNFRYACGHDLYEWV